MIINLRQNIKKTVPFGINFASKGAVGNNATCTPESIETTTLGQVSLDRYIQDGDIIQTTNNIQLIRTPYRLSLPAGRYKIELWGADTSNYQLIKEYDSKATGVLDYNVGGKGGYTYGEINTEETGNLLTLHTGHIGRSGTWEPDTYTFNYQYTINTSLPSNLSSLSKNIGNCFSGASSTVVYATFPYPLISNSLINYTNYQVYGHMIMSAGGAGGFLTPNFPYQDHFFNTDGGGGYELPATNSLNIISDKLANKKSSSLKWYVSGGNVPFFGYSQGSSSTVTSLLPDTYYLDGYGVGLYSNTTSYPNESINYNNLTTIPTVYGGGARAYINEDYVTNAGGKTGANPYGVGAWRITVLEVFKYDHFKNKYLYVNGTSFKFPMTSTTYSINNYYDPNTDKGFSRSMLTENTNLYRINKSYVTLQSTIFTHIKDYGINRNQFLTKRTPTDFNRNDANTSTKYLIYNNTGTDTKLGVLFLRDQPNLTNETIPVALYTTEDDINNAVTKQEIQIKSKSTIQLTRGVKYEFFMTSKDSFTWSLGFATGSTIQVITSSGTLSSTISDKQSVSNTAKITFTAPQNMTVYPVVYFDNFTNLKAPTLKYKVIGGTDFYLLSINPQVIYQSTNIVITANDSGDYYIKHLYQAQV